MSTIVQWIVGLALGVVLLKLLVLWLQPRMAFYPVPGPTPAPAPFSHFSTTTTDEITIRGWCTPIRESGPVFLYSCGNAGNLSNRTELLTTLADRGASVVAYNYRGTGTSDGSPTEEGVYADVVAVYDYLHDSMGVEPRRIILWGHSLGGAVACELAQRRECAGMILEATFRSAKVMARSIMPLLPTSWLMSYRFDNEAAMRVLDIPILFIHGTDDTVIPLGHSEALQLLARHPVDLWIIPNAGHNDIYELAGEAFFNRLLTFGTEVVNQQVPQIP